MKAPSTEIYGNSTQRTMLKSTTLLLTIQVYLHSFNTVVASQNLRNHEKFSENLNLQQFEVIDLDANRKRIMQLPIS